MILGGGGREGCDRRISASGRDKLAPLPGPAPARRSTRGKRFPHAGSARSPAYSLSVRSPTQRAHLRQASPAPLKAKGLRGRLSGSRRTREREKGAGRRPACQGGKSGAERARAGGWQRPPGPPLPPLPSDGPPGQSPVLNCRAAGRPGRVPRQQQPPPPEPISRLLSISLPFPGGGAAVAPTQIDRTRHACSKHQHPERPSSHRKVFLLPPPLDRVVAALVLPSTAAIADARQKSTTKSNAMGAPSMMLEKREGSG